jgi:uncharacterized repeat protein (TIGR01451 family)
MKRHRGIALVAATSIASVGVILPLTSTSQAAVPDPTAYVGYASGATTYVSAANLPPTIAQVGLGQSAAAVAVNGTTLPTQDSLKLPMLYAKQPGRTAYGHGASVNLGLGQTPSDVPQISQTLSEAQSPPPGTAVSNTLLSLPAGLQPIAEADLLPTSAAANTTADGSCVTGKPLSTGTARAANAKVLNPAPGTTVAQLGGSAESASQTILVDNAGSATKGLSAQNVVTLAPITLLAGTPAEIKLTFLAPLRLVTTATGLPGKSTVSYAPVGNASPNLPILTISGGGMGTTLTFQDVFGNGGLKIGLGVADVTIGTPAHALGGTELSSPTISANGTLVSAAADVVRISVPGTLTTPVSPTVSGGALGGLSAVLDPLTAGISQVTGPIGAALAGAGLGVADVRFGHLEASVEVPVGGISCGRAVDDTNPFPENVKDVSALTANPGQTFTYVVRFPNRGTQPVTNAVVTDTYAKGLEFVSSTPAPTSQNGNVLTYDIGTIQPNEVAKITLTFKVPADATPGTKYVNDATISGTYAGRPVGGTVHVDGPTVKTVIKSDQCILTYSSMYSSNKEVVPGENFAYFVNVLNSGDIDCLNVVVRQSLPDGVSFVSCSQPCSFANGVVTWTLGTVKPGQSEVVSVIVTTVARSGTLPGKATISANNGKTVNVSEPDPKVTDRSVPSPGKPAGCRSNCPSAKISAPAQKKELAFTGLDSGPTILAGLALLGGLALHRVRRRSMI